MNTWASTGGTGVQVMDPVTGQWFDTGSTRGGEIQGQMRQRMIDQLKKQVSTQQNLAAAEVEADAQNYEAEQNRTAGQQAFQFALSQAGNRRAPGGGIARGGYGRRGMSLNQATGGLSAANAAARKKAQMFLAQARVAADPGVFAAQQQIDMAKTMGGAQPMKQKRLR